MKKKLIIIVFIIIIICILGGIWWIDNTKIIEPMTNYSSASKLAYNLNESNNEIQLTLYSFTKELVKTVNIYQFDEEGKVKNIILEKHYETKLQAKNYFKDDKQNMDNAKVKDNVVIGTVNTTAIDSIGKSKVDLLNDFKILKDILIEIK